MPSDLSFVWWDILLEAIALVVGVVVGRGMERLAYGRNDRDIAVGTLSRIYVTTIVNVVDQRRSPARQSADGNEDNDEMWAVLGVGAVLVIGSAVLYARHRALILSALTLLTLFGLGLTVGNIWFLARRGPRLPAPWRALLLVSVLFVCTIPLHMYLLDNPVFRYEATYAEVLAAFRRNGWPRATDDFGFDVVFVFALQFFGVVFLFVTFLLLVASLFFLLATVNEAAGARGAGFWSWASARLGAMPLSHPGRALVFTAMMTAVSLLLTGGVIANWQRQMGDGAPTTRPVGTTTTTTSSSEPSP
jgi:hypothetical protein